MVAQIDGDYVRIRPTKLVNRLLSYALFEGRPVTTKGQWINPLLFLLFAIEKRLPSLKQVRKPIFIIGTGRSGTTILGIVLSMHRDIGFLNEPKALWHSAFDGEDVIGSYSRKSARYCLDACDATEQVKKSMHRLFGWYLSITGAQRVVDKYPELIFRVPFVQEIFPDAKFLFLVRNGWDTCHSIQHWSERLGGKLGSENHDWWGVDNRKWNILINEVLHKDSNLALRLEEISNFSHHTDMAAVEWILAMREGLKLKAQYPNAVHMVKYEDLCSDTQTILMQIQNFCELTSDDKFENYAKKRLYSTKSQSKFDLHPAIRDEFYKVMRELGYGDMA